MEIRYINDIDNYFKIEIVNLLKRNDCDFPIPLSNKIDFNQYITKVLENGNILLAVNENNQVIGCITFYNNDLINNIAYISIVCIDKDFRHQRVGKSLLEKVVITIKNTGMKKIILYTHIENVNAINLYKSFGFKIIDNDRTPFDIKLMKKL